MPPADGSFRIEFVDEPKTSDLTETDKAPSEAESRMDRAWAEWMAPRAAAKKEIEEALARLRSTHAARDEATGGREREFADYGPFIDLVGAFVAVVSDFLADQNREWPTATAAAVGSAEKLLEWAVLFAKTDVNFWTVSVESADTEVADRIERIEKIHQLAHHHSTKRSDLQIKALTALEHDYSNVSERRDSWNAGARFPAYRDLGFEDYLGACLTHDIKLLVPASPAVFTVQEADPGNEQRLLEIRKLAYQAAYSWRQVGRPPRGQIPKFEAANRFLIAIGLGAASATALEHTWATRKRTV